MKLEQRLKFLEDIKEEFAQISSEWNGDEPGVLEELSNFSNEIYDKCDELIALLKEVENFI
jgi:hypothetical protein